MRCLANRNAITAVILAGGRSRRLGRDKAAEPFAGEPLLRRVIRRAAAGVSVNADADASAVGEVDVVVVAADAARAAALPLAPGTRTVVDAFPGCGPLGGIYTGLGAARTEWSLVVACDLPFLSPPLLRYLAGLRHGVDIVAPIIDGRPEPTHALYSRRCRPAIAARLQAGQLKTADLFDDVRVRYVDETEMRRFDPELLSFFNINRPADLARALQLAQYTATAAGQ